MKEISGFWAAVLVGLTCPLCSPDELLGSDVPIGQSSGIAGPVSVPKGRSQCPSGSEEAASARPCARTDGSGFSRIVQ